MKSTGSFTPGYEVVLKALGEGGSLTLTRIRAANETTVFILTTNEAALADLLGEDPGRYVGEDGRAPTWEGALSLLDKYKWVALFPGEVHPDFREAVWKAVTERTGPDELRKRGGLRRQRERWREACLGPESP